MPGNMNVHRRTHLSKYYIFVKALYIYLDIRIKNSQTSSVKTGNRESRHFSDSAFKCILSISHHQFCCSYTTLKIILNIALYGRDQWESWIHIFSKRVNLNVASSCKWVLLYAGWFWYHQFTNAVEVWWYIEIF